MNLTMDDNSRKELIDYRLNRALETIEEAEYNARGKYFNAAVNRLYYACYYAASALMLKAGLEASTHKGVRNMLGLHYIIPGKLAPQYGAIYSRLFQARRDGDYEDFVYCDEIMYSDFKPQAIEFINAVKSLISNDISQ